MQELFRETELKMKAAVDHLHHELRAVRTGRASLAILEGVQVSYYGSPTPINQVANLSVADASLIVAQPYDPSIIGEIERAISSAELGLNPSNDGKVIRIPVPPLTEERRKELVKRVHDLAEAARNSVRQSRREGNDGLKTLQRDKKIGQDDEHRGHEEIQKLHDHYIQQIGETVTHKEADIMEV
jgi:ribosome recycling factor